MIQFEDKDFKADATYHKYTITDSEGVHTGYLSGSEIFRLLSGYINKKKKEHIRTKAGRVKHGTQST